MTRSIAAPHAGYRAVEADDAVQGARVPVHVLYPTEAAPRREVFGIHPVELARDAPVAGRGRGLVVVSHGSGGTPWGYRGLAAHLARAGLVVALVEHPGNRRSDDALAGTAANLTNRPRHLRVAVDAVAADPTLGAVVGDRVVAIGHSIGGYTALAAAGGRPIALPEQTPDRIARPVPVEPDPRVRGVVLLAPALPWFLAPGALVGVRVPVLVRTGEHDPHAPPAFVERVLAGLPADVAVDREVVAGAGHFAWFTAPPPELAGPAFPPAQDPPGFDRAAYQARMHGEVEAFVRAVIDGG